MIVTVQETLSGNRITALITETVLSDMPLKKDGWNFNWRQLFKTYKDAVFFKLSLESSPHKAEGVLMVSIQFGEMVYMNNLEVAPQNYGKNKKYDMVAGCLIAFACRFSLIYGKNAYAGFLAFDSKTQLIEYYCEKYGAKHAIGQRLYFDPETGKNLINIYL